MSRSALIDKALFPKFSVIICADVRLTHTHNGPSPWLFDMHSFASAERSLSAGTGAGRFRHTIDNFCFTTRSVVVLFILTLFMSLSLCILSNFAASSVTTLISLIADVSNCACSVVFDLSLIIIKQVQGPGAWRLTPRLESQLSPPRSSPWLTFQPRASVETEHPVGYLVMRVAYSWRQADVRRLKELHWWHCLRM